LSHDKYYGVTLDGKVTKTMYKDNLFLPTKALAIALAEEWESQKDTINLKSLHLHNYLGKCFRVHNDAEIAQYMRDEITNILEND
jgi:chaperone required for assembly of F1-ATPase